MKDLVGIGTMVKLLISIVALTFIQPSYGAEPGTEHITLWGVSHHSEGDHCEFNVGVGYQRFVGNNTYFLGGVYRNSPCNAAPYVGVGYELDLYGDTIGVGVFSGLIGGYTKDNFSTAPFLPPVPYIRFGDVQQNWHVKWIIIPGGGNDVITAINLNYRIDQQHSKSSNIQLSAQTDQHTRGQRVSVRWKKPF